MSRATDEITLKYKGNLDEAISELSDKGFKRIEAFRLEDTYYIHESTVSDALNRLEFLKKTVIIRKTSDGEASLLIKRKQFDEKEQITQQQEDCFKFADEHTAHQLLSALNFSPWIKCIDFCQVMSDGKLTLIVQDIGNDFIFIEAECFSKDGINQFTMPELINVFNQYELNADFSDYFVKKIDYLVRF